MNPQSARRRRRRDWPRIAIIGGGLGGVAAGVKLRRAGFENFTIFEKSSGPGGTWWDNRYPGAEVDVSSHLYSFSFMHYDWTCTHAQQAELQQYVEDVIDRFGLRPNFRFSTPIHRVAWDDAEQAYVVTGGDGDTDTFEAVISAVGLLNQPRYPDWPGLDSFAGPAFHTARWEPEHDLNDKTVALVGTGSTAAQIVPAIADVAGRVVIFQREPGWVVPKPTRVFTDDERAALSKPWNRRRERLRLLFMIEKGQFRGSIHRPGRKTNTLRGGQARAYIERTFKDRPDLREAVTPSYPYPGKRPVIAQGYYEALLRDDVELVPFPVVSVTPTGVVDARGIEYPADILVLSTGFQPSTFLNTFDIVGRAGRTLRDFWHGEPQAFLGITVPEFPNFYMLYGPNTNGGEIIFHLERQAEYAVRSIKRLGHRGVTAIEVRRGFYERYNRWLQRQMGRTAWVMSNNYYKSASGRIVTQWPYGVTLYGALTKLLGRVSEVGRHAPANSEAQPASPAGPMQRLLTPDRWERQGARRSRSRAAS